MSRACDVLCLVIALVGMSCERPQGAVSTPRGETSTATATLEVGGDEAVGVRPQLIADPLWTWVLNNATLHELDSLPNGGEQWYSMRLFEIPVGGSCVEYTYTTCSHQYLLAVSETGEAPPQRVYNLGRVGRVTKVEWIGDVHNAFGIARLRLSIADTVPLRRLNEPAPAPPISQLDLIIQTDTLYVERVGG